MQVLNRSGGVFDAADEELAGALAAQCAVALQRVRMMDALLEGERMKQELELARAVQMSSLPSVMPQVHGYDVFGMSRPATETGGDTFDLAQRDGAVLIVLGDATGHGIAPALSVTQMHAMLRMALRLGADLEAACLQLNNLLAETMAEDRFITAFIGLLDPAAHSVRYLSPGQGPIVHFHAASGECTTHRPTGFPLAAMPLVKSRPALTLTWSRGTSWSCFPTESTNTAAPGRTVRRRAGDGRRGGAPQRADGSLVRKTAGRTARVRGRGPHRRMTSRWCS